MAQLAEGAPWWGVALLYGVPLLALIGVAVWVAQMARQALQSPTVEGAPAAAASDAPEQPAGKP